VIRKRKKKYGEPVEYAERERKQGFHAVEEDSKQSVWRLNTCIAKVCMCMCVSGGVMVYIH
jgi:hypothetical protein